MKKFLIGLLSLFAITSVAYAEEVSIKDGAELLSQSVAQVSINGDVICTAFKIADNQYMTAGHCVGIASRGAYIRNEHVVSSITHVTVGVGDKDDWAVFYTKSDDTAVAPLVPACDEEVYLGMPIAYMGYPYPVDVAYGTGHVTSVNDLKGSGGANTSISTDVHASHGASGSPVISLDTGHLIGILIEGVRGGAGFFMVGLQDIKDTPLCQYRSTMKENGPELGFSGT